MELEYTWASLGSIAGCSAAVLLIVQYVKEFMPKWLPTRLLVWALAFVFLLGAWGFGTTNHALTDIPLLLVNAFVVALTAMGAYETALSKAGGADALPSADEGEN